MHRSQLSAFGGLSGRLNGFSGIAVSQAITYRRFRAESEALLAVYSKVNELPTPQQSMR
jgi:hypothetical protein